MDNNYQNLIDTFVVTPLNSYYNTSNDSTNVSIDHSKQEHDIKAFYDWQIFLPSQNRTIIVSNINSERTTGKRSNFLETVSGYCANRIFSLKLDNQVVNFTDTLPYLIYIHN